MGREAAVLVMIGAVARIAGRRSLERLAWGAVIFGVWDIGCDAWLWVFSGWPPERAHLGPPLPYSGSLGRPGLGADRGQRGLIGFGLACPGRLQAHRSVRFGRRHLGALLAGGAIAIVSFLLNAGLVLEGGTPVDFA